MTKPRRRRTAAVATSALSLSALLLSALPTAALAAPAPAADNNLPLVLRWSDGGANTLFGGFATDASGRLTSSNAGVSSFGAAVDGAQELSIKPNKVDRIRNATDDTCLGLVAGWGSNSQWDVDMTKCSGEADQLWAFNPDGDIIHASSGTYLTVASAEAGEPAHLTARFSSATAAKLSAPDGTGEGRFTVNVDLKPTGVDIFGTALPFASVIVAGDVDGDDTTFVSAVANEKGEWSTNIPTSILKQYPDLHLAGTQNYLGQKVEFGVSLDAKNVVEIDPIDGEVPSDELLVTGTAQKDALVVVKEGDTVLAEKKAEPAGKRAAGDEGRYSIPVAGLSNGAHTLTVEQTQKDSPTVTTRDTIEVNIVDAAVSADLYPFVFRFDGAPGQEWNAGFSVSEDGHLVSTNAGAQSPDKAGEGAIKVIVKRGGEMLITDASGEKCLTDAVRDGQDRRLTFEACDGSRAQEWFVAADGSITNPAHRTNVSLEFSDADGGWNLISTGATSRAKFTAPRDVGEQAFSLDVELDGDDLKLSGNGITGRKVEVRAKSPFDSRPIPLYADDVTEEGKWNAVVKSDVLQATANLPFTATQQLFGSNQTIDIDVDAKNVVTIDGLKDGDTIAGDSTDVRGTALKGAKVLVKEGDTVLAETIAEPVGDKGVGDEGTYTIPLTGLSAGTHTFTVEQTQAATGNASVTTKSSVTVEVVPTDNVEKPLEITTPADGATVIDKDGKIVFTGTGTSGDEVTLQGANGGRVLGSTKVNEDGNWTYTTWLSEAKFIIDATTASENATVTFTVQKSEGVTQPLAITTPADGGTVIDKDGKVVFTGTGTTGDEITLQGANGGRVLGTTKVNSAGEWTYTTWLSEAKFVIDATTGTDAQTVTFTVQKSEGVTQPLAITTPADGSTVTDKDGKVIFTGTGTTGDEITLQGANGGRVLGTTKVNSAGEWTYTTWLAATQFIIDATTTTEKETVTFTVTK